MKNSNKSGYTSLAKMNEMKLFVKFTQNLPKMYALLNMLNVKSVACDVYANLSDFLLQFILAVSNYFFYRFFLF